MLPPLPEYADWFFAKMRTGNTTAELLVVFSATAARHVAQSAARR